MIKSLATGFSVQALSSLQRSVREELGAERYGGWEAQLSSVQSLSHVRLFATPRTAALQASLSITNSQSLLKIMSIEVVMPTNHLIFCRPLLRPVFNLSRHQGIFHESVLHIRWPKYWSFSFSISLSNEYSGLISFRMD